MAHRPPITSVNVGNIRDFGDVDYIRHRPLRENEYPVVTLTGGGQHFYDIRDLIRWVQTSQINTFPHNRQRIHWLYDLDVAEWHNHPADYVTKTRAYLDAAREYAPLWALNELLTQDEREQKSVAQTAGYIVNRNYYLDGTYFRDNIDEENEHYLHYWIAHPYSDKDEALGLREPNPEFLRIFASETFNKEAIYSAFRRENLQDALDYVLEPSEFKVDDFKVVSNYWDAHPLDPLKDSADVIAMVRRCMNHMAHFIGP